MSEIVNYLENHAGFFNALAGIVAILGAVGGWIGRKTIMSCARWIIALICKPPPIVPTSQVVSSFVADLTKRLKSELIDPDWIVLDSVKEDGIRDEWEMFSVGNASWNSIEKDLRLVLANEKGISGVLPGKVFFSIRAGDDVDYKPRNADLGESILSGFRREHKGSSSNIKWWPRWWKWPGSYRDWSETFVRHELGKPEVLSYFVNQFLEMSRTMEMVIRNCPRPK